MTAENDPSRIAAYYDTVAQGGEYDLMYNSSICDGEDIFIARELIPFISGDVLDVGCGSGLTLEMQAHGLKRELYQKYVGIDVSDKLLNQAKRKYPNEKFMQADMHHLPVPNHMFDTIVSIYGPFSYSLSPDDLLCEFKRVLRPGGKLFIMPYTLRTGHSLHLGGESTAVEPSIAKIFYCDELARENIPYPLMQTRGLNYFVNPITNLIKQSQITSDDINCTLLEEIMNVWSKELDIPKPYVPHKTLMHQVEVWRQELDHKKSLNGLNCLNILEAEKELANYVPPEFARHMFIKIHNFC